MVYHIYRLNSIWMVYMIHENYDLVLMTPRCGMIMMIYIYTYIHVLYDSSYEGYHPGFMGFHLGFYDDDYVAMRPLWTDLWKGRIWA